MLPVAYGPAFFNSDLSIFKNFAIKESMKLQIRAQAYNFLNHPLYSFPSGNNLTLQFQQDPVSQVITQANTNFGVAKPKAGTARYRVWSEVLLLIPHGVYERATGISTEGFRHTVILFSQGTVTRYAEALSSFCFSPRLSPLSPGAGTDDPPATGAGRHAEAAGG